MANVDNPRKPSAIGLFVHELRNTGGDGSAKSLALGVGVLMTVCTAATGAFIFLANNPQVLNILGIR